MNPRPGYKIICLSNEIETALANQFNYGVRRIPPETFVLAPFVLNHVFRSLRYFCHENSISFENALDFAHHAIEIKYMIKRIGIYAID